MEHQKKSNQFDQYIQYKALSFKFDGTSFPDAFLDKALDMTGDMPEIKNVCAKLHVALSDRLDQVVKNLDISKRKFIEIAIIQAIERSSELIDEVDMFENLPEGGTK